MYDTELRNRIGTTKLIGTEITLSRVIDTVYDAKGRRRKTYWEVALEDRHYLDRCAAQAAERAQASEEDPDNFPPDRDCHPEQLGSVTLHVHNTRDEAVAAALGEGAERDLPCVEISQEGTRKTIDYAD